MASNIKLKNNINSEFTVTHEDNQGAISVSSTDLSKVVSVDTIADLRATTKAQPTVWVSGYYEKGDGAFGSNIFEWDATSTEDDNGGTIIKLASVATGRYKLRYSGSVNVKWFGAVGDGVTDDSIYIGQCIEFTSSINGEIDFSSDKYRLGTSINKELPINTILTLSGSNATLILDDGASWEQIQLHNRAAVNNVTVNIKGLDFIGGENTVAQTYWGAATATYTKNVPLSLDVNNINISDVTFTNIWGKALQIGYFTNVNINNIIFDNVGGHSYTYSADAYGNDDSFGDAIYFNRPDGDAEIRINNMKAIGMYQADAAAAGGGLSRAAIVCESTIASSSSININIDGFKAENFERTFHVESTSDTTIDIKGVNTIKNTALLAHSYLSNLYLYGNNITYIANSSVAFLGNVFFLDQIKSGSSIRNSKFYNISKAWDSNPINVPSGVYVSFENSNFYFNDGRYQSKNSSITFQDCNIFDYNDDVSNSSQTIKYNSTSFSTTMSATYGNLLSDSAGNETFYLCNFTNQLPSIDKTIHQCSYRDDTGLSTSNILRVNNATTDIPLIKNAVYEVIEVDNNRTLLAFVNSSGSIYHPATLPYDILQAGSSSNYIRLASSVTFSCFVRISQYDNV